MDAINSLGICYRDGIGCERDVKLAFKIFKKNDPTGNLEAL